MNKIIDDEKQSEEKYLHEPISLMEVNLNQMRMKG